MPIQVLVSKGMVERASGNLDGPTYCKISVGINGTMSLDDVTLLKPLAILADLGQKVCILVDASILVIRGADIAVASQRSREVVAQADAILRRSAPNGQISVIETLPEMQRVGMLDFSSMYCRIPWKNMSPFVSTTHDVVEMMLAIRNEVWMYKLMGYKTGLRHGPARELRVDQKQFGMDNPGYVVMKPIVGLPDGNIFLSSSHTPILDFYQHWMNLSDAEAVRMLPWLTDLPLQEIKEIEQAHAKNPQKRYPQRILANNMTKFVHGGDMAERAMAYSNLLFGGSGIRAMDEPTLEWVSKLLPHENLASSMPMLLSKLLCKIGLCCSNAEAKRIISQGGISMNDIPYEEDVVVDGGDLRFGKYAVILRGKKTYRVAIFEGA